MKWSMSFLLDPVSQELLGSDSLFCHISSWMVLELWKMENCKKVQSFSPYNMLGTKWIEYVIYIYNVYKKVATNNRKKWWKIFMMLLSYDGLCVKFRGWQRTFSTFKWTQLVPNGPVVEDKVKDGDGLSWLEHCTTSQILVLLLNSQSIFCWVFSFM